MFSAEPFVLLLSHDLSKLSICFILLRGKYSFIHNMCIVLPMLEFLNLVHKYGLWKGEFLVIWFTDLESQIWGACFKTSRKYHDVISFCAVLDYARIYALFYANAI